MLVHGAVLLKARTYLYLGFIARPRCPVMALDQRLGLSARTPNLFSGEHRRS